MRRALAAALVAAALTLLAGSTSVAAKDKNDRATGTFTANGCLLTDSVSWSSLPPVFRIDTTLLRDGHPYVVATSIIRDPRLGQRALTSPQLVETFGMSEVIFTHGYAVEFVLSDRHGRVLARTASPTVTVSCDFA